MVAAGDTLAVPLVANAVPTPLLMLTDVAFVVVHDKVEDPPAAIDVGEALKVIVGGGLVTVIVTDCCVLPPAPVATAL